MGEWQEVVQPLLDEAKSRHLQSAALGVSNLLDKYDPDAKFDVPDLREFAFRAGMVAGMIVRGSNVRA